jgi:hypothetical protein
VPQGPQTSFTAFASQDPPNHPPRTPPLGKHAKLSLEKSGSDGNPRMDHVQMVLKGIVLKRLGTGRAEYFFPLGQERKKVHVAHLITLAQLICSTGECHWNVIECFGRVSWKAEWSDSIRATVSASRTVRYSRSSHEKSSPTWYCVGFSFQCLRIIFDLLARYCLQVCSLEAPQILLLYYIPR